MFHLEWSGEAGPEHAVGWLRLNRTGELHLEELRLPCNEEPPDWLYRRVFAWTNQTSSTLPQGALP
jgi:hypothetical protein